MVTFGPLDLFVLAVVIGMTVALGVSTRMRHNTAVQLLVAGRKLSLPLFVATLVTTWYGGILGVGEMFDGFGWSTWLAIGVPYYLFGLLYARFFAKRVRDEEQISLPERMERCYGKLAGLLSATLVLIIAIPAAHVFMLATLAQSIFPALSLPVAATIGAALGTIALYRGGLLADARANVVAFVMMYLSFAAILVFSLTRPLPAAIDHLPATHTAWHGGQGALFLIGWFMLGAWTLIDPGFHQRVAAARDSATSRAGVYLCVALWALFDALTIATAHFAYKAIGAGTGAMLFPLYGNAVLPEGIKGLFFTGMLGLILSAMVGYTLVSGGTIGRDIFSKVYPRLNEAGAAWATRAGMVLATIAAIVIAVNMSSVVYIWYDLGGIAIPGLLFPTLFAYGTDRKLEPAVAGCCLAAGSGSAAGWLLLQKSDLLAGFGEYGKLHHIYAGLVGAGLALAIGTTVTAARRKR